MTNFHQPSSTLFKNEPYKWEILYQCTLRKIISGDMNSIKGLMVLLASLNKQEKENTLNELENILDNDIIIQLRELNYRDLDSNKNLIVFLSILFCIFTNPYGIEIKRDKQKIYEKTGMFFYKIKKVF